MVAASIRVNTVHHYNSYSYFSFIYLIKLQELDSGSCRFLPEATIFGGLMVAGLGTDMGTIEGCRIPTPETLAAGMPC